VTGHNPYRSSLSTVTPRSLDELFAHRRDLETDDGMRLKYSVLPWKRVIATIRVRPDPSLADWVERLSRKRRIELSVEGSENLPWARFVVQRSYPAVLVQETSAETFPIRELESVTAARIQIDSRIRFAIGDGECRFAVSSYEPSELASRFERAFPWDELELPPIVGRTWLMPLL
jgi:hypothetical protein